MIILKTHDEREFLPIRCGQVLNGRAGSLRARPMEAEATTNMPRSFYGQTRHREAKK
jgi:hypothetical protein